MSCSCSCNYDYDYIAWLYTIAVVKARKEHWCYDCGMIIASGESYARHTNNDEDGVPFTTKHCIFCHLLRKAYKGICGCGADLNESIDSEIAETFGNYSIFELPYEIRGILFMRISEQSRRFKKGIGLNIAIAWQGRRARDRYLLPHNPKEHEIEMAYPNYTKILESAEVWYQNLCKEQINDYRK